MTIGSLSLGWIGRHLLYAALLLVPLTHSLAQPPRAHDVVIRRDTYGVPHILGRTDADAAYGFAYAHAEDDFVTIQEAIFAGRGKLASLTGSAGKDNDILVASLGLKADAGARYPAIEAATRAVLEAYAQGLNDYAARHPRQVAPGLLPVRGSDLVAYQMFTALHFFHLDGTVRRAIRDGVPPPPADPEVGSNGIAVAPSRSADRATRLLVNSHQPFEGRYSWYEAVIESGQGWHVAGGFFPGLPFMLHGHNENLGWANTVNRPDLTDLYALEINPSNPDQYRLDGKWRSLKRGTVTIEVRQPDGSMKSEEYVTLRSVHGPAFRTKTGTVAVRYAGMGNIDGLEYLYRLNKARNISDFRAALATQDWPSVNYIYADKAGNIGFVHNGQFPVRKVAANWTGTLPGNRSDLIWSGYLPPRKTPQIWNPSSGYVFNVNNSPFNATAQADNLKPSDFSKTMGLETTSNNRVLRIGETFGADTAITDEEFQEYKYDVTYSRQSDVALAIDAIAKLDVGSDAKLASAKHVLAAWDRTARIKSKGAPLALLTWQGIQEGTQPLEALKAAIATIETAKVPLDVEWGRVSRLRRGDVDLPVDGAPDLLRAIYGRPSPDGKLAAYGGDSYVMFVQWDAGGRISSRSVHQWGAAPQDKASPHYADQAPLFAAERTKPVLFTEAELKGKVAREYVPGK